MNLNKLKSYFHPDDIEWRIQQSGIYKDNPWGLVLAYVTNRAIMNRLDEVCTPGMWKNEFVAGPAGGIMCGISIKIGDEWVTKWDGAENTAVEEIKGGFSASMKRAAVQWGIGRYLYYFPSDMFAVFCPNGIYKAKIKGKDGAFRKYKWNPPEFPKWAIPAVTEERGRNENS